jgi:hypothetical protein
MCVQITQSDLGPISFRVRMIDYTFHPTSSACWSRATLCATDEKWLTPGRVTFDTSGPQRVG